MDISSMYELPYDLDRYFTRPAGTVEVALTEIVPGEPHAVENANKFMRLAYEGKKAKRKPISLVKRERGGYKCRDGNSTLANAIANSWPKILAIVED